MKKGYVIGLASFAVIVWVLFFFLLIDEKESMITLNQEVVSFQKEKLANEDQFVRVMSSKNEHNNFTINAVEANSEEQPAHSNPTQNIMYEMEKKNPVSIDELLSALNINLN
ncbi:hypothetical protein BN1058_02489 [Paraliobacillus sp. PM-2]|uniref:hypothetical protein n=1 Tax=Paraliobacillus sp. PM-2 TaxID=1462524 RepID=UPI00061C40F6|nr:hypothetical protein [Paraliobacillus sp. PM-2]CQR48141.1 hypothetical protein BN1058_02489 [Paraliobacillus sp. PM-2]